MSDLDRRLPGVSEATVRWIHAALTLERLAFVDRALAGTLLRLGAPRDSTSADVLALGTVLASSAPREGHTLFDLGSEQEPFPPLPLPPSLPPRREWEALLSSLPSVVGRPEAPAPLVVEGGGLYLYRYWRAEVRVARLLADRLAGEREESVGEGASRERLLEEIFPEAGGASRAAALAALGSRLLVLTGGPGTGKTWTAARLLLLFRRLVPGIRVVSAAPTGKAAARMGEALAEVLPPELAVPSMTLHRLLGASLRESPPRRGEFLPWDLVLLDELSMVDLLLMESLLSALSPRTRLVLVGDQDQLSPVGAGAVMGDLCRALSAQEKGVPRGLVVLSRNYRQRESGLLQEFSRKVAEGDGEGALRLFERGDPDLVFAPVAEGWPENLLVEGFSPLATSSSDGEALERLGGFMALSPFRDGPMGALRGSRHLERVFSRLRGSRGFRAPAMILQNSYDTGLMNGDLGILSGERLVFAAPGRPEPAILPLRMAPPWETAFVMTVHKSQGSEFDRVCLLLGGELHPLLTRRLLYTAATRAKKGLVVWASPESFLSMVRLSPARSSGLESRLSRHLSSSRPQS
ncbi:MAG: exodeoxyribonuclease V subunit alpha [Nitrospirae bacterium]|nr:exodeoxyribonuclease V subunit alpha [Nitrospirota bacterium]